MVYKAIGDRQEAADCHRKVMDFIRAHPENYFEAIFHKLVDRFEPSPFA